MTDKIISASTLLEPVWDTKGSSTSLAYIGLKRRLKNNPIELSLWGCGYPVLSYGLTLDENEAIQAEIRKTDEEAVRFVLQNALLCIPISIVISLLPQIESYHGQSLLRLAQRGGLGLEEVYRAYVRSTIGSTKGIEASFPRVISWLAAYYGKQYKEAVSKANTVYTSITFDAEGNGTIQVPSLAGKTVEVMSLTVRYRENQGSEFTHEKVINHITSSKS